MRYGGPEREANRLGKAFERLDPARTDPAYWVRFRETVLSRSLPELARRRRTAPLSLGEVMSAWARALLPAAAVTAAVGALLISRPPTGDAGMQAGTGPGGAMVGVEELLVSGIEGATIPATLDAAGRSGAGVVMFVSDGF